MNLCISAFFALLAYASLRFSLRAYGDYLAPIGLFFCVNLSSLSFYHLKLLSLTGISLQAYVLIAISLFSFLVGVLFASPFLIMKKKALPKQGLLKKNTKESSGLVLFYYLTAFLGIAGWVFYVTVVTPPGWLSNLWLLQGNVMPHHLGYLTLSGTLVLPIFVLIALIRHRITFLSVCFLLGELVALMLVGIKSYLIIGLATSILVWAIARPGRIRMKHIAILVLCIIGFMIIYDHFIDVFVQDQIQESKFPTKLSFLKRPYLYMIGSWSAMSAVMGDPPEPDHWGQVTLQPLWQILGPRGLRFMDQVQQSKPFLNIGSTDMNVYSLIGELYWDYGWFGSIFGCIILGFVSTKLYVVSRKYCNWRMYLFNALFCYGLFISLFAYYYRTALIFLLLYVLIIGRLSRNLSSAWRLIKAKIICPTKNT